MRQELIMQERSGDRRSGNDRRKTQLTSASGWDGVERRSKRDQRTKNRRRDDFREGYEQSLTYKKRERNRDRRAKDRAISDRRKGAREGKELVIEGGTEEDD